MNGEGPDASGESVAENAKQLRSREIEERSFAAFFQVPGVTAAEVDFDQRSPERPHVISAGFGAVVAPKHAAVAREFIGVIKRYKQFVGEPQGKTRRGLDFAGQGR